MNVTNEMGVIVELSKKCESMGWEIVGIQAAFPDMMLRNIKTGEVLRVELEYNSSSFYTHRHDPRGCDLIVCWIHDWDECVMPVWELSKTVFGSDVVVEKMDEKDRRIMDLLVDVAYWKNKANDLQGQLQNKGEHVSENRNYICACGSSFYTQSALNAHQRKHKPVAYAVSTIEPVTKDMLK